MADNSNKKTVWDALTIAIPAYSRPVELVQLLQSIEQMRILPGEVLICEDKSPERELIRGIAATWTPALGQHGCVLHYVENTENLGYDGNVRKLFAEASRDWVMLMGNDDLVLPDAVPAIQAFRERFADVRMISRTYFKFQRDIGNTIGLTKLAGADCVYDRSNATSGMIVRLTGFVGGLIVNRAFALRASTNAYDGTLYYQVLLAALAFCDSGLGYIATPIVASRAGNTPLFGSASKERSVHKPGSYSADSRLAMWRGILRICSDVEKQAGVPILRGIRRELGGNQSFHVFELVAVQGRRETWRFARGLYRMGLFVNPRVWLLTAAGLLLGRRVRSLFGFARTLQGNHFRRERRA
jgi:hypothetical protein